MAVLAIPDWIGVESTPAMTAADGAFAALAALQANAGNAEVQGHGLRLLGSLPRSAEGKVAVLLPLANLAYDDEGQAAVLAVDGAIAAALVPRCRQTRTMTMPRYSTAGCSCLPT